MLLKDKLLTCRECGQTFVFTAGEQEFYQQKGFTNEPQRCTTCRAARRSQRGDFGAPARPQREMHEAVCSSCGRIARVPFVPRGDRPVYCSDCFQPERGASRW